VPWPKLDKAMKVAAQCSRFCKPDLLVGLNQTSWFVQVATSVNDEKRIDASWNSKPINTGGSWFLHNDAAISLSIPL
jgi:hypothetical protein